MTTEMAKHYRDAQLEEDLLRQGVDDKALSRVLKAKRDLGLTALNKLFEGGNEVYDYYAAKLKDIPASTRCECCGVELIHVYRKDGKIVGSECVRHRLLQGECRKR